MITQAPQKGTNIHKYLNANLIHQFFLKRFLDSVFDEICRIDPKTILDFGCGEGFFLKAMHERGLVQIDQILGVDIRKEAIIRAKSILPQFNFTNVDIFELNPKNYKFDLVIAIETLEHLHTPDVYVSHLMALSKNYVLFTIPHEPWFRIVNFLRGRNILKFGNHPDHINHWSLEGFKKFISSYSETEKIYSVFPWIVYVGYND
jgi:2-polyprenyl-3-methyl-5-hydroxy-6-metoxy-1,4-benzoquinol methylase